MKNYTDVEVLEIMKVWVHNQRKNLKYDENYNAVDFASDLMVKLCSNPAFEENDVLKFIRDYKK